MYNKVTHAQHTPHLLMLPLFLQIDALLRVYKRSQAPCLTNLGVLLECYVVLLFSKKIACRFCRSYLQLCSTQLHRKPFKFCSIIYSFSTINAQGHLLPFLLGRRAASVVCEATAAMNVLLHPCFTGCALHM